MNSPAFTPRLHRNDAGDSIAAPGHAPPAEYNPARAAIARPTSDAEGLDDAENRRDILIVDDDRALLDMLRMALQDEGYAVDVAGGGGEGLTCLQRRRYYVLMLDLMMPHIDGLAVLQALREQPSLRPPAVVVISSLSERADMLAAIEAGADDYVVKPFDLGDLILRVNLWLRRTGYVSPPPHAGYVSPPPRAGYVSPPPRAGLRVHSLGRFHVESGGQVRLQAGGRARKANALFKYLLTHQERAIPTDELFHLLWPHTTQDVAAMDLRSLLHQLRKLLGASAQGSSRLAHTGSTLTLHLGPDDWWDVAGFTAWLDEGARCRHAGDLQGALDAYAAAVALYAGDYLAEDLDADWTRPLREQLREDWLRALEAMAAIYGECGDHVRQEQVLRTVLRADRYREPSHRTLMALLVARGRSAEALVLYRQLAQILHAELDASPDPETQALARRIRQSSISA